MQSFFELVGAFCLWMLSGFKGSYESYLSEDYRAAISGLVAMIVALFLMILIFNIW